LQVEADIKPFRGILLGLFFVTTGASLDLQLLLHEWPIVLALLVGLLAVKIGIIGGSGLAFGLTRFPLIPAFLNLYYRAWKRMICPHFFLFCLQFVPND
jgi:Kef-type K+ transport system membrane component KefB